MSLGREQRGVVCWAARHGLHAVQLDMGWCFPCSFGVAGGVETMISSFFPHFFSSVSWGFWGRSWSFGGQDRVCRHIGSGPNEQGGHTGNTRGVESLFSGQRAWIGYDNFTGDRGSDFHDYFIEPVGLFIHYT